MDRFLFCSVRKLRTPQFIRKISAQARAPVTASTCSASHHVVAVCRRVPSCRAVSQPFGQVFVVLVVAVATSSAVADVIVEDKWCA